MFLCRIDKNYPEFKIITKYFLLTRALANTDEAVQKKSLPLLLLVVWLICLYFPCLTYTAQSVFKLSEPLLMYTVNKTFQYS